MKISSPIGDLPFRPDRLTIEDRALVIRGSMGAWPTRVIITLEDIPATLRLIKWPLAVVAILAIAMFAAL